MTISALPFYDHYLIDEETWVNQLLDYANPGAKKRHAIKQLANQLVANVRSQIDDMDGVDAFMKQYDLSSKEGILLMCLAEALLRIPDKDTADKLIRDKILEADWKSHLGKSDSMFVNASTWGLMLTGKIIDIDESKGGMKRALDKFINKTGEPVIRQGIHRAMQVMGKQFVMGRNIKEAIKRSGKKGFRDYRYSYDMLGEAALTQADADRYFEAYLSSIGSIAEANKKRHINDASSISIKLSALHPRYEVANVERVMAELAPKVLEIANHAKALNVAVTIDAEEADRLEISLKIFQTVYEQLQDYQGFGLVVQAYQKRALKVLEWLADLHDKHKRLIPLRLVKGAYWDTEIKRAQEQGLSHYPVFTRKVNTDVSYLACAQFLLSNRSRFYPQFATHNANTVAAINIMAGESGGYEYQRLHGMGQALHAQTISEDGLSRPCRIYAPVGSHEDLLPYLVRRLLENGANTSFVNRLTDLTLDINDITQDPIEKVRKHKTHMHPALPLPSEIYGDARINSAGVNLGDMKTVDELLKAVAEDARLKFHATSLIPGAAAEGELVEVFSPADLSHLVGTYNRAETADIEQAINNAQQAFPAWRDGDVKAKADCLLKLADLMEQQQNTLIYLLQKEAGKTLGDCIAELREAVDFCRYYAHQAAELCSHGEKMPGPTGESNYLYHQGKGVFVCISPWNFPLAIYAGQIVAALVTGNCVIAKPAEQTSLIGHFTAELIHQAGIPKEVFQLILGSGSQIGNQLCQNKAITGVVFTGSTQTAQIISLNLANSKSAAIATLIAETGGQNCMIADSSCLPEQLVKDVVNSAFLSAGQRCSALRILYIQDDVADKVIEMLQGAMDELVVGQPDLFATDLGPVIDEKALGILLSHKTRMEQVAKPIKSLVAPAINGHYFGPQAVEISDIKALEQEVFGPFLHVIRYQSNQLDQVIDDINSTGYGLTFGIHSRIDETIEYVVSKVQAGNCYINRNMTGAVVGVQPFGGMGLSGTGPKAGGPGYLRQFMTEKTITNNISAVGGNADLLELSDDD
ncbi:bifunctional proline dehydrogenase/L-glutamate gamma-semialdehyde dehydrogenase PutA [Marinicella sp. S1101]|uniref:bifunctional proline dehydrogenase/L-glutamate gamma-semialdehyde dehydrogenase PutA n=1 Tax=Marinicella marina TaxID=2996016 RepID=UPI002260A894|nr:bifunctional proline dehydrogenase/L-glutamate gamma-semialdehyde dehydrogenase PutA [Marinicella marina]MCX7552795.1 bifunctional proline dehydrogenase/L-glutamate gamma-semialdehyde dehydrogenase PutA [Marinicella marina]